VAEKKVANSIVALSSAAVLAIYGAGYARTREAADRFAQQAAERRPRLPAPQAERPTPAKMESAVAVAAPIEAPAAPAAPAPVVTTPAAPTTPAPQASASASTTSLSGSPAPQATPGTPSAGEGEATLTASSAAPSETPAPPAAAPPAVVAAEPAKPGYKDGTYYGWGTSRHGDIQAEVVIEEGRIVLARVEKCQTRWSCNWVIPIPPVILKKQASTYDYVSGATDSSDAFQGAVAEALSQAK
jgi:uncharacterized protein with FMN-binding domain